MVNIHRSAHIICDISRKSGASNGAFLICSQLNCCSSSISGLVFFKSGICNRCIATARLYCAALIIFKPTIYNFKVSFPPNCTAGTSIFQSAVFHNKFLRPAICSIGSPDTLMRISINTVCVQIDGQFAFAAKILLTYSNFNTLRNIFQQFNGVAWLSLCHRGSNSRILLLADLCSAFRCFRFCRSLRFCRVLRFCRSLRCGCAAFCSGVLTCRFYVLRG